MESAKIKVKASVIFFTFACLMILLYICADTGKIPEFISIFYDFPYGDKVAHIVVTGFFAFIFQSCCILNSRLFKENLKRILTLTLIITICITAEEFSQLYFVKRTFSIADLLCSYVGIWLSYFINIRLLVRSKTLS